MDNRPLMPIPPLKHVLDDLLSIPYNNVTTQVITLAKGTINPDYSSNNHDVRNGSKVTRITIQLDIEPSVGYDTAGGCYYDWYIAFNIAGAQSLPAPNAVGNSDYLTQIFHQDQGVIPLVANTTLEPWMPAPQVIRLTLDIPRSWQVLAKDDTIELRIIKNSLNTVGNSLNVKLKCIYKEIYP